MVTIGDFNQLNYTYANYKESNCHPNLDSLSTVIIEAMEYALINDLDHSNLGMPITYQMTIKDLIDDILNNSSCYPEGDSVYILNVIIDSIIDRIQLLPDVTYI